MSRHVALCSRVLFWSLVVFPAIGPLDSAWAGRHARRARRGVVVTRARPVYGPGVPQPGPLGTFMPTPTITVRGNDPVGGGYSPLGIYGNQTMSLFGPFSPLRSATAPVVVYSRGYDGVVRPTEAISTSYPNLPVLSPVVYPTQFNNYYGPRVLENPHSTSAINWIDQN